MTTDSDGELHESSAMPDESSAVVGIGAVYAALRADILSGELASGQILNQVHLAERFGVSRTPLREALRMLQADGLVQAERQHRMRVTTVEPDKVDAIYAQRILLEAVGLAITIPNLRSDRLEEATQMLDLIGFGPGHPPSAGDKQERENAHKAFHLLLTSHAPAAMRQQLAYLTDHSDRYRRMYRDVDPMSGRVAREDHAEILDMAIKRDLAGVTRALTRHYARTALVVMGNLDPEYSPKAVTEAIRLTREGASGAR